MAKMNENLSKSRVYEDPDVFMTEGLQAQPRDGNDNKSDEPEEPTPQG